jgi:hypothetical protein
VFCFDRLRAADVPRGIIAASRHAASAIITTIPF